MTDAAPKTTVVLPVWDHYAGDRLTEALTSLRQQDVVASIVVVDNASHVELPEIPEATVLRSPKRLTLGEARNLGLAEVTSPYVVAWDADDLMLPGTLTFLENAIGSNPALAAVATAIVEESTGRRHRWPRRWTGALVRAGHLFAILDSVWSLFPTTGATIMRTDFARSAGGYGAGESGEDWCLGVSLAFRGRIGWSERPGRVYRVHDESVWGRHMSAHHQLRHARAVRERIHQDREIPDWTRAALPLIRLSQYAAIASHGVVAGLRRARSPRTHGRR